MAEAHAEPAAAARLDDLVWRVVVPQALSPAAQAAVAEHPVRVLDDFPHLSREVGQGDGRLAGAVRDDLSRLLLGSVVQRGNAGVAFAQFTGSVRAVVQSALDEVGEGVDGERGVGLHGERGGVEAAVVCRPTADGELAERHVDEFRAGWQQMLQLAGAVVLAG